MHVKSILALFIIFLTSWASLSAQGLVINEFSSSNYNLISDVEGDFSDWIELHNDSDTPISLSQFYISDNPEKLLKWKIPEFELQADSFLVIFASGKDTVFANDEFHSNFSIKSGGEQLHLSQGGLLKQSVDSVLLEKNQSYGFSSENNGEMIVFDIATPGQVNYFVEIERVVFSHQGGIYDTCFTLTLSNSFIENKIYYTLDGSVPDSTDYLYSGSISINELSISEENYDTINMTPYDEYFIPSDRPSNVIILRAAVFDVNNECNSNVVTNTYLVKELGIDHSRLPVVSISAEFHDLFDFEEGIFIAGANFDSEYPNWTGNFYKRGVEWERNINLEMYESDNYCAINQLAGLRTHGGLSRLIPQKGLKVYADLEYGRSSFYYKMFAENNISEFKRFVLKPYSASPGGGGIENYISGRIASNLNVCHVDSRPVVLYLNGVYWGIYYIGERIDEYYIEAHNNVDRNSVTIIENWKGIIDGEVNSEFIGLYNFISQNDMSNALNYYYVTSQIDILNFIDYQIIEIFAANFDWPYQNMKCWKSNVVGSKWKWIFFDGDACFGYQDYNMFDHATSESDDGWPTDVHSTLFFRKLMQNNTFKLMFTSRLQELLLNNFTYENTQYYLEYVSGFVKDEVNNQISCFGNLDSFRDWVSIEYNLDHFLVDRTCMVTQHYKSTFGENIEVPKCEYMPIAVTKFEVYPNPNHGDFSLKIELDKSAPVLVSLTNCLGQTNYIYDDFIYEGEGILDFTNIETSPGIYLFTIYIDKQCISTKMMIE